MLNIVVLALAVFSFWLLGAISFSDFSGKYPAYLIVYESITIVNEVILCLIFHKIGKSFNLKDDFPQASPLENSVNHGEELIDEEDLTGSLLSEMPLQRSNDGQAKVKISHRLSNRSNDYGMISSLLLAGSSDLGYKSNKLSGLIGGGSDEQSFDDCEY